MKTSLNKKINHLVGKAIFDWDMIQEKDKILVGVSGGKDSQAMLNLLFFLKKRAPVSFEIIPVYVDAGFDDSFAKELQDFVQKNYGDIEVVYTDHGIKAHSDENSENPCFLCSRLRRSKLFELAKEHGCRKIALGHNKDDLIETLFINIFYAGKIGTMKPRQSFFDGELDIIRPLSYVEKSDISLFCETNSLQEFKNNCPSANNTKRGEIRDMLEKIYKQNKHIKGNIFRSMGNIASEYLLDKKNDRHPKST